MSTKAGYTASSFKQCTLPGEILADPSHRTMGDLGPVINLLGPIPARQREGSAVSRPHPAAPCSPAYRSSTSSRCSSCRCCIRNSSSRCYTMVTVPIRTVRGSQVDIRGHHGMQRDQGIQTRVLELSRSINRKRLLGSLREVPLLLSRLTHSLLHLHHNPPSPSRFLLLQSPRQ